jgi:hypothetical protein
MQKRKSIGTMWNLLIIKMFWILLRRFTLSEFFNLVYSYMVLFIFPCSYKSQSSSKGGWAYMIATCLISLLTEVEVIKWNLILLIGVCPTEKCI